MHDRSPAQNVSKDDADDLKVMKERLKPAAKRRRSMLDGFASNQTR